MCPISWGFDLRPRLPKKTTSAGRSAARPTRRQLGEREPRGELGNLLLLPVAELEQTGDRVGGLGTRRGLAGEQLELLLPLWGVDAGAARAGGGVGAGARGRAPPRAPGREPDRPRHGGEAEHCDEAGVELANQHRAVRLERLR